MRFSHYAAALIYRNAQIQLNGPIFSFGFEVIFHAWTTPVVQMSPEVPAGIMACSVTVHGPPCAPPDGFSGAAAGNRSWNSPCIQLCSNGPTAKASFIVSSKRRGKSSPVTAQNIRSHLTLAKPCKKHWSYCGSN